MRKTKFYLLVAAIVGISIPYTMVSCDDDEEVTTTMTIDKTSTTQLKVGETATAVITIVAEEVKTFQYYKVVDEVKGNPVDAKANLTKNGNNYTYNFSYVVQEFDDLHTLGFEFELIDQNNNTKTVALVVNTSLSVKSSFVKYDWKVTESTWLGVNVLTEADAAIVYRFNEDGTYDEDLGAQYAADNHHFCYWALKETPNNGDTIAIVRLIRRLKQGDTAIDEYYDYNITSANSSTMTMYWDLAFWGLYDIKNIFTSQPKGAFQPYGTAEMAAIVEANDALSCSHIDPALLTIP